MLLRKFYSNMNEKSVYSNSWVMDHADPYLIDPVDRERRCGLRNVFCFFHGENHGKEVQIVCCWDSKTTYCTDVQHRKTSSTPTTHVRTRIGHFTLHSSFFTFLSHHPDPDGITSSSTAQLHRSDDVLFVKQRRGTKIGFSVPRSSYPRSLSVE